MIGFQLKGTTKRQKITCDSSNEKEGELIVSISDGDTIQYTVSNEDKPLVIPLCGNVSQVVQSSEILNSDDLNKVAEHELIAELTNSDVGKRNDLIIGVSEQLSDRRKPLLLENYNSLLKNITNDDEKFKVDMTHRAPDMNFKSEIYETVPVSQFGAALLRGMGWSGDLTNSKDIKYQQTDKIVPRENRLGLGASAKPPDSKRKSGKDDNKKVSEWKKKAECHLSKQKLQTGDLVWLREARYANLRARVVATSGVPGLDQVRVQLEKSGALVEVHRKDSVLLTADELACSPYSTKEWATADVTTTAFFGLCGQNQSGDVFSMSKALDTGKISVDKNINTPSSSSAKSLSKAPSNGGWLRQGIRVKIVSKTLNGGSIYKHKGVVVDVMALGVACVRLDSGAMISEVKESQLETILPHCGGVCVVLIGPHKGEDVVLLQKDVERESVLVELCDDLEVLWMSMDSIAAHGSS